MNFQSFAQSPWILPVLPWLATPIVLVYALRQRGFLRVWGVLFALLIACDGYASGAFTTVPPNTGWATFFSVGFVILGDFRYYWLVEQTRAPKRNPMLVLALSVVLAFVVPLAAQFFRATTSISNDTRTTYLTYEALFLGFLMIYGFVLRRRKSLLERRLFAFELVQYVLWASLDVLLLATKADVLHLFRIIPDVLYYVVFIPFAIRTRKVADAT
ncbi:hypothetical protein BH09MYX1_BH09MYX1_53870 [soil metagenome]